MHYYEEVKNMLKILEIARNEGMEQGILQTAKERSENKFPIYLCASTM